jgi:hypothetical protein
MSTAEAGDAPPTASAELQSLGIFGSAAEFKVLDTFDVGGKSKLCPTTLTGGTHHPRDLHDRPLLAPAALRRGERPAGDRSGDPEGAAPRPVVDPNQPVISVVMERDLGSRRTRPLICIGSALFSAFVTMLHHRDKESMARRVLAQKSRHDARSVPPARGAPGPRRGVAAGSFITTGLAPKRGNDRKSAPYECGIIPAANRPSGSR